MNEDDASSGKLVRDRIPDLIRRHGGQPRTRRLSDEDAQTSPFPAGSVVLISGIMGAGKSTVAQLLAERLPRAAHIRGDAFRRMIVSGRSEMVPSAEAEALSQLQLRYRLATMVADAYAEAGFTAVYQDILMGDDLVMDSRQAVRVLLFDEGDRVLLVRFWDGERSWWCTPGGDRPGDWSAETVVNCADDAR